MRVVTATATIHPDHTLTVQVPIDVRPGLHTVVVILEGQTEVRPERQPLQLTPHPVGPADATCTYHREDMYGDDGR
jgi:hypothetical protein